jgi:hypothetical protein
MPKVLWWAVPGIVVWLVLQSVAIRWLTEERDDLTKYGFAPLVLLAWWLPNLAVGETGASVVEQFVLIAGFPIAAVFLVGWLISELVERRKIAKNKLRADS